MSILQAAEMTHEAILPACLADSGDLAFVCQLAEAYTANTVVTQISVGTTADLAAIVFS